MYISLFIQTIILIIVGIFSIIYIVYFGIKDNNEQDYYKWIRLYNEQKDKALKTLKKGNKKIDNLEIEISKYKKKLDNYK